jgi:hypothetical protein
MSAQDGDYRIKRGVASDAVAQYDTNSIPAPGGTTFKPLTGGIEHRANWTNPNQMLNPLSGNADNNQLRGNADNNQLRGQTNSNMLQGKTDTMQMRAAVSNPAPLSGLIKQNPLRIDAATTDTPPFALNTNRTRLPGDVNDRDLKLLRSRDIVIFQDRSSSMGEHESFPQGYFPRWYWCLSQAMDFRRQTTSALPNWPFTLVLFSSKYDVYRNVTMEQMPSIFDRNHIWIGTLLAPPMEEQLNEYFMRKARGGAKPLLIAIVTDGKPKDEGLLADVIINATRRMQNPSELHITFLLVGTDDECQRKMRRLDNDLVSMGARFDIVSVMPFNQVTQLGLTRSLVTAIQNAGR